jgi:hypothetical protein
MGIEILHRHNHERLPVFLVGREQPVTSFAEELVRLLFKRELPPAPAADAIGDGIDRYEFDDGGFVHVNRRHESIWMARKSLWGVPSLTPDAWNEWPKELPGTDTREQLVALFQQFGRSKTEDVTVKAEPAWTDGARMVVWDRASGNRTAVPLDRTDAVTLTVSVSVPEFRLTDIPIAGPGAGLTRRGGRNDQVLGFSLGLPIIRQVAGAFLAVAREEADEEIRAQFEHQQILFDATLAYRLVDAGSSQYLVPFWHYEIAVKVDNRLVQVGSRLVRAVRFDFGVERIREQPDRLAGGLNNRLDWGNETSKPRFLLSWMGKAAQKLPMSYPASESCLAHATRAGWIPREFADLDAAEADWKGPQSNVTTADLACYIGHGQSYGFSFCKPTDTWLSSHECAFGERLKWVITDSCGPLHDEACSSGGSTFLNWGNAFKGLRSLLGFATPQVANSKQLPRALEYALLKGTPVAKAWFQAVCELQGTEYSTQPTWVAGLFAVNGARTTIDDCLSPMPTEPVIGSDPAQIAGVWVPVR